MVVRHEGAACVQNHLHRGRVRAVRPLRLRLPRLPIRRAGDRVAPLALVEERRVGVRAEEVWVLAVERDWAILREGGRPGGSSGATARRWAVSGGQWAVGGANGRVQGLAELEGSFLRMLAGEWAVAGGG